MSKGTFCCVPAPIFVFICFDTHMYCRYEYNNQFVGCDNFSVPCLPYGSVPKIFVLIV